MNDCTQDYLNHSSIELQKTVNEFLQFGYYLHKLSLPSKKFPLCKFLWWCHPKVKKIISLKMHHIKKITSLLLSKLFKTKNFHAQPKKFSLKINSAECFLNRGAWFYSTFGYF